MARLHVLLASVCFGTTGTAQALGPEASPLTVGASRIAVGALLLLAVAWLMARRAPARDGGPWPRVPLLLGGLGVAGYQLCFFAAVDTTGVAVGTVVALGSGPAFAGAGAWLVGRERPTRPWVVATLLASVGVALIALAGSGAEVSAGGVALALGAGASYATYTLTSKRLLDHGHGVEPVMARQFALGAVLLLPVLLLGDLGWLATGDGVAMAVFLGLVPTAIAYLLFARGLRHLPAGEVATLTLAEPVTATVFGAAVLGERPGGLAVAGIVLILAGLAALGMRRLPRLQVAPA